jgi:hypothetical protein
VRLLIPVFIGAVVTGLFAHHVAHYYFLGDDCFISFRYALNLTEGHGLVFNRGERVEGYTNFLWVLLMAGTMALDLPVEIVSNLFGIACGVGVLFLLACLGAQRTSWTDPFIWIAPLALAANRTFCAWSTGGLETQLFALLTLAAYACFVTERERRSKVPWKSAALFSLAALTRPEGVLFFGIAGVFSGIDWLYKRRRFSALAIWTSVFATIVGSHIAWRYGYYGYLLPNTFYAKVSGWWLDQGSAYLGMFIADHQLVWLAPLVPLILVLRRDFQSLLFFAVLVVYTVYLLCIGGDRFEYRFMTPIMPYLFWLLQEAVRAAVQRWPTAGGRAALAKPMAGGVGLLIVAAGYYPNTLEYERRHQVAHLEEIAEYADRRAEAGRFLRSLVEDGYLTGDELIAVGGAGALPYYSRMPVLDTRGLSDVAIAHQKIARRGKIGHEKIATREYIRRRGVIICDVLNRIVLPEGAPQPERRTVNRAHYQGPVRCVTAKGRYLVFATTLNEDEFRRVFARFRIVH